MEIQDIISSINTKLIQSKEKIDSLNSKETSDAFLKDCQRFLNNIEILQKELDKIM